MKKYTVSELRERNGKDGKPVYVSLEGKVHDLSKAFLWQGGEHQSLHRAGHEMTDEIKMAPHGPEMLDPYLVVGELIDWDKEEAKEA